MKKQYYQLFKKFYTSSLVHLRISDLIKETSNRFQKLVTIYIRKLFTLDFAESLVAESVGKSKKKICSVVCNFLSVATDNAGLMKKTSTEQDVKQIKTRTE